VPFNIGFHLAHHVDAGVPFRNLPKYHQMLIDSSYINVEYEHPNYRSLWSALHT
jgi:fatty acid desaturase